METMQIEWGKKQYTASWGAIKYKGNAQTVAEEIESIGDAVTSQEVVDYAAENKDSELHKCFEWDDSVAANGFRCMQARSIMGNLKVTIIHNETKEKEVLPVRYFSMAEHSKGKYEKTEVIVKNIDRYQVLLTTAIDELRAFQAKYSRISELSEVFAAIDEL